MSFGVGRIPFLGGAGCGEAVRAGGGVGLSCHTPLNGCFTLRRDDRRGKIVCENWIGCVFGIGTWYKQKRCSSYQFFCVSASKLLDTCTLGSKASVLSTWRPLLSPFVPQDSLSPLPKNPHLWGTLGILFSAPSFPSLSLPDASIRKKIVERPVQTAV